MDALDEEERQRLFRYDFEDAMDRSERTAWQNLTQDQRDNLINYAYYKFRLNERFYLADPELFDREKLESAIPATGEIELIVFDLAQSFADRELFRWVMKLADHMASIRAEKAQSVQKS